MLINNELHILNGRTLGDIYGEYTCIQSGGASVVDYFIISPDCDEYVCHMSVQAFTCFSDHKPVLLTLNFPPLGALMDTKKLHETYDRAPLRLKINAESHSALRSAMADPETKVKAQAILDSDYPSDRQSTYTLNADVTEHLQKLAGNCLQKTKHPKLNKNGPINKQPWFTNATREAKQNMAKAAGIVSEFPDSDYLRKHFYRVKGHL